MPTIYLSPYLLQSSILPADGGKRREYYMNLIADADGAPT